MPSHIAILADRHPLHSSIKKEKNEIFIIFQKVRNNTFRWLRERIPSSMTHSHKFRVWSGWSDEKLTFEEPQHSFPYVFRQKSCFKGLSTQNLRKRLKWLGHTLRINDDRLPRFAFFSQPSRAKRKVSRPRFGWQKVVSKDLREIGTSWEGVRREAMNGSECGM